MSDVDLNDDKYNTGGGSSLPGYIGGLPEGYVAFENGRSDNNSLGRDRNAPVPRVVGEPQYREGEEFTPASWSPETIAAWQGLFVEAGLVDDYRIGVWDADTRGAYKTILGFANQYGIDAETAIRRYVETDLSSDVDGSGGPQLPPKVVRVSNPEELALTFKKVSRQQLGGDFVDDDTISAMVAAYQSQERQAADQSYDAQLNGGTITAPQSAGSFAENQLEEFAPNAVDAAQTGNVIDGFFQSLGPSVRL